MNKIFHEKFKNKIFSVLKFSNQKESMKLTLIILLICVFEYEIHGLLEDVEVDYNSAFHPCHPVCQANP